LSNNLRPPTPHYYCLSLLIQIGLLSNEVDRINRAAKDGSRRVRIHAVGFPVVMEQTDQRGNTGERFATLMRALCQRNGGTFVGLNSTRPWNI